MRHRKHTFKIGRTDSHRRALLANQVCSLILTKQISTTIVKAKETKRIAEKMVTLGKSGTLHDRRRAISKLHNRDAVKILFDEIAPIFKDRKGGYTRIIQLGQRIGDAAEICILQWVESFETPKEVKKEKAESK
ncbi:MAG: 50S ribosomal protein L17 [Lentisphaerota bacterium]